MVQPMKRRSARNQAHVFTFPEPTEELIPNARKIVPPEGMLPHVQLLPARFRQRSSSRIAEKNIA
jgi:hypothetical protein